MPLIPLASVTAVFEGPKSGAVYGFITGLVFDAFIPGPDGFYAIYLLLVCFATGLFVRQYFRISFFSALVWHVSAHSVSCLIFFLFFMFIPGKAGPQALLTVVLPELLLTLPYLPFAYIVSKKIHMRFDVKY